MDKGLNDCVRSLLQFHFNIKSLVQNTSKNVTTYYTCFFLNGTCLNKISFSPDKPIRAKQAVVRFLDMF